MLTQEYLRERYEYHPDGYLIARKRLSPACDKGERVGSIAKNGYIQTKIKGKHLLVHRLIYIYHHGEIEHQVDHINNDRTDNRIENLRDVTHKENGLNRIDTKRNGDFNYRYYHTNGLPIPSEVREEYNRKQRENYRKRNNDSHSNA